MTTTLPKNLGLAGAANLDHPRYLVSYSFQAPDKDAAQAATDELESAMQTWDGLPVFEGLEFFKPVQVATNVAPVSSSKKILRLDAGEVSALMAAILDGIDHLDAAIESGEADEDAPEQIGRYRALADKLVVAQRDGIA